MNVFDNSEKKIIAGPITIGDDDPVTKYRAESDGRTFWAYNGMEVFYESERMYHALDRIQSIEKENQRLKEYVQHKPDCPKFPAFKKGLHPSNPECTCGFDKLNQKEE